MDFLDLHPYPGYLPLPDLMDNFGVKEFSAKLWVLSELGGVTFVYGSLESAATGLQDLQTAS